MNHGIHHALAGRRVDEIDMPIIRILPHGELPGSLQIQAPAGTSLCEAMLEHDIEIEHACEMSCACTTCHVSSRRPRWLGELDEAEEDLLDRAWGLEPTSRLWCQAVLSKQDVTIEIPKYTINHAQKEGVQRTAEAKPSASAASHPPGGFLKGAPLLRR